MGLLTFRNLSDFCTVIPNSDKNIMVKHSGTNILVHSHLGFKTAADGNEALSDVNKSLDGCTYTG